MKIEFATSTNVGGLDDKTRIAFSSDGSEIEVKEFAGTEIVAILEFASNTISAACEGGAAIFHSRQNTFRDAFEKGWFERWTVEGFEGKSPKHRDKWRRLHKLMIERRITVDADGLMEEMEDRLAQALVNHERGWKPYNPAPGDPFENPWSKPTSVDEIIDRAIKRDK